MKPTKKWNEYKYHASFASEVRCVPDEKVGKFLSLASLDDLKTIIPDYALTEGFDDLLPIAANACVVNMGNKRGDMISTATAVEVRKQFNNKFINLEHDRKQIVGHLVNSGYSKFDVNHKTGVGSEPLDETAIASVNEPFNVSLAGFIYAVPYPEVVAKILEANDPNSDIYMNIGMSWEMAFDDYKIAVGSNVLSECDIISDPDQIEQYSQYLKSNKGSGQTPDGKPVFRLLDDGVMPLGVGLTFAPAAAVSGVFTMNKWDTSAKANERVETTATDKEEPKNAETENNTPNPEEKQEKVSQASSTDVTINITNSMKKTLKSFEDLQKLNDENVGEYSLANVPNVVEAEVTRLAREHQQKLDAEKEAKASAEKNAKDAQESLAALQKEVQELKQAQAKQAATQTFNDRMGSLDEEFQLDDKQRKAVANQIRDLDDASFEAWKTNVFEAFAAKKSSKKGLIDDAEDMTDGGADEDQEDGDKKNSAAKKNADKIMSPEAKSHKAKEEPKKAKASAAPSKSNPDPDGDGDDDTKPSTDKDNSHWNKDGTKKTGMWSKASEEEEEDETEDSSIELAKKAIASAGERKGQAFANSLSSDTTLKDKFAPFFKQGDGIEIDLGGRRQTVGV